MFSNIPRSFIVPCILNEISNVHVITVRNRLTFIQKTKNPSSEQMQYRSSEHYVILSSFLHCVFSLPFGPIHSSNFNLTSVSCNPFHNHEELPPGGVAGSRRWKCMTHIQAIRMVSFCMYRSQPRSGWAWGPDLCFYLSILTQLLEGNSCNRHDSGNILQICSILAMLQSETRVCWPAATGGNPHGDILHIPEHVLLTEIKTQNFPLQTGTERLSLSDCRSATRTGIGTFEVPAPVSVGRASPRSAKRSWFSPTWLEYVVGAALQILRIKQAGCVLTQELFPTRSNKGSPSLAPCPVAGVSTSVWVGLTHTPCPVSGN